MTSNRLPILAAAIRKAHADVQDAAKTAAERAIAAGHALLEAKELVKHGEWLPWLREHCALAERTAQLYMQIAKSGNTPEVIAAIGLQGAAQAINVIIDPDYNPWANCDTEATVAWHVFMLFLVIEWGWYPEGAWFHVEYILQSGKPITPCDWLYGEKWTLWQRTWGMRNASPVFAAAWQTFLAKHRHRTVEDIEAELNRFHDERGEMPDSTPIRRRRRTRKSATIADLASEARS